MAGAVNAVGTEDGAASAEAGLPRRRPAILLTQPFAAPVEAALAAAYEIHRLPAATASAVPAADRIRAVVTGGAFGLPRALMDELPALEIVAVSGIGTDAIDLDQARTRGVRVTTTPGVLTDDVADMAMGLILATLRRLSANDALVKAGRWPTERPPLARKVTGKRLGLLGLGRVGRAIARRAEGFAMPVSYSDLRAFDDVPYRFVPALADLAREVDVLVVAASGGPRSSGLVDAAVLDALGPDGVLINVARGSVVDEEALVAALAEGRLGGAGLDVFADEPNVPAGLRHGPNVVLQPHQASATLETRLAMGDVILANLAAHFDGRPPPTAVV